MVHPLLILVKPFGDSMQWVRSRPWEAIETEINGLFPQVEKRTFYGGIAYLITSMSERERGGKS